MTQGLSSSSGGMSQASILGNVTRELKNIETETPNTLELILKQKHSGVSDLEVGTQIVQFLNSTSARVSEVTNRGYQEIEKCNQDSHNREQALNYWKNVCSKVLKALQCLMENYFEQKLTVMERGIAQQITEEVQILDRELKDT